MVLQPFLQGISRAVWNCVSVEHGTVWSLHGKLNSYLFILICFGPLAETLLLKMNHNAAGGQQMSAGVTIYLCCCFADY